MAKIKNLNYHWKNFNLIIPQWEFSDTDITAVWGSSGSGKSTLLQIMAGLINCPQLEFTIKEDHFENLKAGDRHFGYVFQDYALFPHLTSWENIIFPAEAKRIPKSIWGEHGESLLKTLDIEKIKDQKASSLSGGEQQRVALARALILKPKLVLMDEPFSALDENLKEQARNLVVKLNKQYQVPFIIVSHDPRDVKALSQNLLILKQGTVKAQGKTIDLLCELA